MGFSETALRTLKPDIVYISISGFGETGPYTQSRVYDPVIQALSSATDIQADRTTGEPATQTGRTHCFCSERAWL